MANDWSDGYITDIEYTYGFYRELTPNYLAFAMAEANAQPIAFNAPLQYCELGCGQGLSTNLLAAANPHITFYANDFNPKHIVEAQSLARAAGLSNAHFYDHPFAEFAAEKSLPEQFDIISLHGIYAWISPENRKHIVDFIRLKLRPGGIVYVSYNSLPGWSSALPLRQLMLDHSRTVSGTVTQKVDSVLNFVDRVVASQSAYFAATPTLKLRVDKMRSLNKQYIAHEYFNEFSTPFYFEEVAAELNDAKLRFVGSAHLIDRLDWINLRPEQLAILNEVTDQTRRESLRDFMTNQQFRRDIYARGTVSMVETQVREMLLETRFVLSIPEAEVSYKIQGALGEGNLLEDVYRPIVTSLAGAPKTVRQMLTESPAIGALGWAKLRQALAVLIGNGHVQPCLPAKDEQKRAQSTRSFNLAIMRRSEIHGDIVHLASPVTGGGVHVDRISQLFLLVKHLKHPDPVRGVWDILQLQGQALMKDGQAIEGTEANLEHLRTTYDGFQTTKLPAYARLGIA